jgi:hypothetical protein
MFVAVLIVLALSAISASEFNKEDVPPIGTPEYISWRDAQRGTVCIVLVYTHLS